MYLVNKLFSVKTWVQVFLVFLVLFGLYNFPAQMQGFANWIIDACQWMATMIIRMLPQGTPQEVDPNAIAPAAWVGGSFGLSTQALARSRQRFQLARNKPSLVMDEPITQGQRRILGTIQQTLGLDDAEKVELPDGRTVAFIPPEKIAGMTKGEASVLIDQLLQLARAKDEE